MIDYRQDYYKGLAGVYFNRILKKIIEIGRLKEEKRIILDFGCGVGKLKKLLKKKNVIGYDILPELTEVGDYRKLKPNVIVCNNVLEHLSKNEVYLVLKDFKKMNKDAILITATPTENLLSKLGMIITGLTNAHDDHKIKLGDVNKILSKECKLLNRKNVFTLSEISSWAFK